MQRCCACGSGRRRGSGATHYGEAASRVVWGAALGGGTLAATAHGTAAVALVLACVTVLWTHEAAQMLAAASLSGVARLTASAGVALLAVVFWQAVLFLQSRAALPWLLSIVWTTDVGALVVGRVLGGRTLPAAVSAGKTLTGALGGWWLGAYAGAAALQPCWGLARLGLGAPLGATAELASVLAAAAIVGDLAESACKRACGVKDSDTYLLRLGAHGGMLDRLDSLLVAAPVLAAVLSSMPEPLLVRLAA